MAIPDSGSERSQFASLDEGTSFLDRNATAGTERQGYGSVAENDTVNETETTPQGDEDGDPVVPAVENTTRDEEESTADGEDTSRDGAIGTLTRRLRCLFSTITWPIVPLGTIVALALLWVLYAASSLDLRRSCSHPLHWYALASLILVAYIPHHAQVRSHLFHYSRERDGPIRPARVRMYDQFFHTICLLYVYTGVTLIQTCREDVVGNESVSDIINNDAIEIPADTPLNSCAVTCPNLYQALSVYVATLEMFTFALILPLLFLPCIYLWFLRRATAEAEAFAQLQDRLQEEEALLNNGGITADEILGSLENVKLVSRTQSDSDGGPGRCVWLLPSSATDASIGMNSDVKECCICMSDFPVQDEADLEDGLQLDGETEEVSPEKDSTDLPSGNAEVASDNTIVRTRCGHIFHRCCLACWLGSSSTSNPDGNPRRRRARNTRCPLCREQLFVRS